MEFSDYQLEAAGTDQFGSDDKRKMIVPLLGLAGEAGSLLTEYKKQLRDGPAYRLFRERVEEELGDILWYVATIARHEELDLNSVASANLRKVRDRWRPVARGDGGGRQLFDEAFPASEQLPREFRVTFSEIKERQGVRVVMTMEGRQVGNELTDNTYRDDGYRFHDAFHLAHAAVLGWSPVTRKLLALKRKSNLRTDEVEDGGRATAIEEGIVALVFDYGKDHNFLDGIGAVDYELLRAVKRLTSHLEVSACSLQEWQDAILQAFAVWRALLDRRGGVISGDLLERRILFHP